MDFWDWVLLLYLLICGRIEYFVDLSSFTQLWVRFKICSNDKTGTGFGKDVLAVEIYKTGWAN